MRLRPRREGKGGGRTIQMDGQDHPNQFYEKKRYDGRLDLALQLAVFHGLDDELGEGNKGSVPH